MTSCTCKANIEINGHEHDCIGTKMASFENTEILICYAFGNIVKAYAICIKWILLFYNFF